MAAGESRGSLLVVDDEAELVRALCEALADEGFRAVGAGTPGEALALLRRGGFDVLLTDLMMPGGDGVELLRAAREVDRDVVAVVMTGLATDRSAAEAAQAGAIDYVPKPFRLGQVLPVLERAVEAHRERVRGGAPPPETPG